jgi:hypothetical protein
MMADLSIQNEGNIYILRALTDAGKQWVAEHIPADAMTWSIDGVVVEHRSIGGIAQRAVNDGLEVGWIIVEMPESDKQ